jgi:ATP-binding cassette, subfamily B (MDR/TAP), member 1
MSNIRCARSMGLEKCLQYQFNQSVEAALQTGLRGSFVEGSIYGMGNSLTFLAEALVFYVGAVFLAKGTYTYYQIITVINLLVFTVGVTVQLLTFGESSSHIHSNTQFN